MIITHHEVVNYRNIKQAAFSPSPEITVITGENGQGKTNLLESVWLLSGAKSFRGSKDGELVQFGSDVSRITSLAQQEGEQKKIELIIGGENSEKKGRYAFVNKVPMGRAASLAGQFFCVVFAPSHLFLVKGPPEGRRRFLDGAICQLYPGYISTMRRYARILQQKNALLKEMRRQKTVSGTDLLEVMDQELSVYGSEISLKREAYLKEAAPFAIEEYSRLSSGKELFSMQYKPAADTKEGLYSLFEKSREEDLRAGFCTAGPHREDVALFLDGRDARIFSSQGQQRSIALCLKLAEAAQIEKTACEAPVILLDDVLSELDAGRQNYLLNQLFGRQVLVTGCDSDLFSKTDGKIYEMKSGELTVKE